MTATTAPTRKTQTSRTPWSPSRTQSKSSTTPAGHPSRTPASVGQNIPPMLTPNAGSSLTPQNIIGTTSPSYFGLVVPPDDDDNPTNSDAGMHARRNWKTPSSSTRSNVVDSSKGLPHEANPSLAAFRKQSATKVFQLDPGSSISNTPSPRQFSTRRASQSSTSSSDEVSPRWQAPETASKAVGEDSSMDIDITSPPPKRAIRKEGWTELELPRRDSPASLPTLHKGSAIQHLSHLDGKLPRLSLPHQQTPESSSPSKANSPQRPATLPANLTVGQPTLLSAQDFASLMESTPEDELLLLDVRVSPQYAASRVRGALNLCIPTTLLKRPSFNVMKLLETFTVEAEKQKFTRWKEMSYIVMYDANSTLLKDATSSVHTLKKFTNEGWHGLAYIVRGGFAEISKRYPSLVKKTGDVNSMQSGHQHLALNARPLGGAPVAGGLSMPTQQTVVDPFFGNIRQNMDLIGGVGQLAIQQPEALTHKGFKLLPKWLQRAADETDKGKTVSEDFLSIEKAEQERMRNALSTNVIYGDPIPAGNGNFQVAGIEKGNKNRYKDILPYDHTRVKIQDAASSTCDYFNASYINTARSHRRYIATQAPIPATFNDFWRVVWEQDVRVIVMLSAETEGGQRKCHPYWLPDTYGTIKLKTIAERKITLESSTSMSTATPSNFQSPLLTPQPEKSTPRRRAVTHMHFGTQDAGKESTEEAASIVVRTLTMSHVSEPFQPMREVVQLHYSNWPDFGAPAHPADLLSIVELTNNMVRKYNGTSSADALLPAAPDERPIIVHCSAGCGRTGTFCTVDSVVDMLKRQRLAQTAPQRIDESDEMQIDGMDWLNNEDEDLINQTVNDFRHQRLSMVQTLKQYVLCYETVLEWLVKEVPEKFRRESLRRSFYG